jgi:hypothetical protein
MPLMAKSQPLTMQWCLECHRDPGKSLRPLAQIYSVEWKPDPAANGFALAEEHHLDAAHLTNCSVCHR